VNHPCRALAWCSRSRLPRLRGLSWVLSPAIQRHVVYEIKAVSSTDLIRVRMQTNLICAPSGLLTVPVLGADREESESDFWVTEIQSKMFDSKTYHGEVLKERWLCAGDK
jgi:hypothetical protein